jgi:hypothetical protein
MRRWPADRRACSQFTGDLDTSPTRYLLGPYITDENEGRACAGIVATAEMLISATPTAQSGVLMRRRGRTAAQ